MSDDTMSNATLNSTAQNLLRIVIASYFLAVGLNLIPGTSLAPLAAQVVPPHVAEPLSAMVVFALAFLVMIGLYMRPAALVLGLLTFFASYLRMIELGVEQELGGFWRDLGLIAALMLTYAENAPRDRRMRKTIGQKITPRRVRVDHKPERPRPAQAKAQDAAPEDVQVVFSSSRPRRTPSVPTLDNVFSDLPAPNPARS
ncbi:DoxX family protein [Nioella nitratireducens]|uniref:DoxX family protein n=1 Tax=Nioella nitratireducens TaxID=1287720 RepID=UPI0011BA91FE|nr:DoxX family protein [Nioella nitratireducens]